MFVIAITGHSGAGKSTLIQELVRRLGDAISLSFDDYQSTSKYPPTEQWLEEGADPNQFATPDFAADAQKLVMGEAILHPITNSAIRPARYLVLEEHFGRGRNAIREMIDFVVLLDLPLELAHARKLLRKNDFLPWEDNPELFIRNLREHLNWYIRVGQEFYTAVDHIVREDCDLIVDGTQPTSQIALQIVQAVKTELSNNEP